MRQVPAVGNPAALASIWRDLLVINAVTAATLEAITD
jgi:hypothetical protein